jgi:hypothetical protein
MYTVLHASLQRSSEGLFGVGSDGPGLSKHAFVEAAMANVVASPKHSLRKQVREDVCELGMGGEDVLWSLAGCVVALFGCIFPGSRCVKRGGRRGGRRKVAVE